MLKASWMALLSIGMLFPAAGLADEAVPVATLSVDRMLAELAYESRWQLRQPVEAMSYSDDWTQPIAEFNFQDPSALARVSKLRSLSLLTLGEFGQGRLFFGVNEKGLVGVHFNAFPRSAEGRYLELVRMPYLTEDQDEDVPDTEFEQLAMESN